MAIKLKKKELVEITKNLLQNKICDDCDYSNLDCHNTYKEYNTCPQWKLNISPHFAIKEIEELQVALAKVMGIPADYLKGN